MVISSELMEQTTKKNVIKGIVKPGQGQGQALGAKTANLDVALAAKLAPGLYLSKVILGNATYQGLLYYGYNMLSQTVCLEVHLLDFTGDIYGKQIAVTTERYLRLPKKFDSLEELAGQIKKDLAVIKVL